MRPLGIVLLVLGLVLLFFGLNSTQAVAERVVEGVTGHYTKETMLYIISGFTLIAAGLVLAVYRK